MFGTFKGQDWAGRAGAAPPCTLKGGFAKYGVWKQWGTHLCPEKAGGLTQATSPLLQQSPLPGLLVHQACTKPAGAPSLGILPFQRCLPAMPGQPNSASVCDNCKPFLGGSLMGANLHDLIHAHAFYGMKKCFCLHKDASMLVCKPFTQGQTKATNRTAILNVKDRHKCILYVLINNHVTSLLLCW
eukprot:scaffold55819_cov16-Tisochrysis_lutea.AAC.1